MARDYGRAIALYRKSADQGNKTALFILGRSYARGEGVPQDYAQAAAFFRKAADRGSASAAQSLAELYGAGQGVPQDDAEAYFWFSVAAEHLPEDSRADAVAGRDAVMAKLSEEQLARLRDRVRNWRPTTG